MTKSRGKQSFFTGKKPTHHSRSKERCHIIVWRQIGLKARDKHGQTTAITKCKRLYFYHSLTFQKSFLTKTACLEGTPVQQALLLAYATKMEFISKPVDWKPAAEAANTWQANRRSFQNSSTHSIFTDTFFSKTGTLTHQSSISWSQICQATWSTLKQLHHVRTLIFTGGQIGHLDKSANMQWVSTHGRHDVSRLSFSTLPYCTTDSMHYKVIDMKISQIKYKLLPSVVKAPN